MKHHSQIKHSKIKQAKYLNKHFSILYKMGAFKAPFMDKTQKKTRPRHVGVGHHEAKVDKTIDSLD